MIPQVSNGHLLGEDRVQRGLPQRGQGVPQEEVHQGVRHPDRTPHVRAPRRQIHPTQVSFGGTQVLGGGILGSIIQK